MVVFGSGQWFEKASFYFYNIFNFYCPPLRPLHSAEPMKVTIETKLWNIFLFRNLVNENMFEPELLQKVGSIKSKKKISLSSTNLLLAKTKIWSESNLVNGLYRYALYYFFVWKEFYLFIYLLALVWVHETLFLFRRAFFISFWNLGIG